MEQPRGLTYPCSFPVKVFIRPDAAVEERLQTLVRNHLQPQATLEVERRNSSTGKYLCLTLTFVAEDEAHLTRITGAISADPGVVLSL
jgi:putative lipoic acid-binding regulatory protein